MIGTNYSSLVRIIVLQWCVGGTQNDRIAIKNVLASVRPIAFRFRSSRLTFQSSPSYTGATFIIYLRLPPSASSSSDLVQLGFNSFD